MDEKVKKRIFLAIRIIIPVILIFLLFRNLDWSAVSQTLQGYPIWIFVLAVFLYGVANLLFCLRWYYILKSVQIKIPFLYLLSLVFYSLFLSNFLPTTIGGDVVKVAGLFLKDGTSRKSIKVSTVIADRIFSMASKILLLPFTLWFVRDFVQVGTQSTLLGSSVLINWLPINVREKLMHYLQTIKPWFHPQKVITILGISWVSLFVNILSFWLVIRAVNPTVSALQVFCVTLLTYFASVLPISFNGIGVQEGSITYLLTLIGFGYEEGMAAALLIRLITIVISLIGGIWLLFGGQEIWRTMKTDKANSFEHVSDGLDEPVERNE